VSSQSSDEARTLRGRHAALAAALGVLDARPVAEARPALVAQTTHVAVAYPATPGVYYACVISTPGGVEAEGVTGTVSADGGTVYALNIGTAVPPEGTAVVLEFVGGRWAFCFRG
jgi:hypothetical protein